MSDRADTTLDDFVLDGVQFFAGGEDGTLFYIPPAPVPQRDGQGRPAVSVVRTPQAVLLQVGAQFALTPADLKRLAGRLWDVKHIKAPRLQPALISVAEAVLLLADQHGTEHVLATSTSSRFPPFNAAFSTTLDAEQGASAIGSVNGRTGVLFVEYRFAPVAAALAQPLSPTVARRADVATWFQAGTGMAHVQIAG
jgi:hypothetical protein